MQTIKTIRIPAIEITKAHSHLVFNNLISDLILLSES